MKVTLLGSGHVAHHLFAALTQAGAEIVEVYSRTPAHARALAKRAQAHPCSHIQKLNTTSDVYILALRDDALADVIAAMPLPENGLVLHTSGSTAMNALDRFVMHGVLYPLQTLSKNKALDFRTVNLCLESSNAKSKKQILAIGKALSDQLHWVSSEQRLSLHVAAVFACNFTNHLYALAEGLMNEHKLPFSLMHALILETATKASTQSPQRSQTGPAIRSDQKILKKHAAFLKQ
ncbi:MAG: Rossmann-like and DUF2520 domain-containing protein, partial [Bacteroidia bacterium]